MTEHHRSSAGQPGATASGNVPQMTTTTAPTGGAR